MIYKSADYLNLIILLNPKIYYNITQNQILRHKDRESLKETNCLILCKKINAVHISYLTNNMELIPSEKHTHPQLIKKFSGFYGTERSIAMLTEARHFSLTSATWIESTASHPTYLRCNLILSSHLNIHEASLLQVSPPKTPKHFSSTSYGSRDTCHGHLLKN